MKITGYLESLDEMLYRNAHGKPKARPIVYKGIAFRSRLERRFATHLDAIGERWRYEPRPYGPRGRGYLPDFEIIGTDRPTFIEVKPTLAEVEAAKVKAAVIWQTYPGAVLLIAVEEGCTFYIADSRQVWDSWQERWAA